MPRNGCIGTRDIAMVPWRAMDYDERLEWEVGLTGFFDEITRFLMRFKVSIAGDLKQGLNQGVQSFHVQYPGF